MIAVLVARALKVTAITFSGIAIGGAGSLVLIHVRDSLRGQREAIAFAIARIGFCIIVALLAKLVIRLPELPPTADVWWYVTGLVLSGLGYAWLAVWSFRKSRRRKP